MFSTWKKTNWLKAYSHENMQRKREKNGSRGLSPENIFEVTYSRTSERVLLVNRVYNVFILDLYSKKEKLIP